MFPTLRFRCYYCNRVHEVDAAAAGKRGRCVCGKAMIVPGPGAVPDEAGGLLRSEPAPPEDGDHEELTLSDASPAASTPPASIAPADSGPASGDRSTAPTVPGGRGRRALGMLCLLLAVPALGAWVFQAFCSGEDWGIVRTPHHLGLPSPFWATLAFGLFLALLLEGIWRVWRRPG